MYKIELALIKSIKLITMKTSIYIAFFWMLFTFSSCENYLDIEPKGVVSPTSVEQLGELLNGKSVFGNTLRAATMMGDEHFVTDDEYSNFQKIHKNGYSWMPLYDEGDSDLDWKDTYSKIYLCNYVLSLIDDARLEEKSELDRNKVKAIALSTRSFEYFNLVNVYGAHFNPQTSSTDLAVPMLLKDDLKASLPRSSVADIYNQILGDLLLAEELFSSASLPEVRADQSKTGVYGTLSRVYTYRAEWSKAAEYASKALNNYSVMYNYNDYTKETADETRNLNRTDNIEMILMKNGTQSYCRGSETFLMDELVYLFEPNDLRFLFFTVRNDNGEYIYSPTNSANIFPLSGISTPEMYLNRAEANARLGNITEAMDDLLHLRKMRFDKNAYTDQAAFEAAIVLSASNSEEAIGLVLEERRRELMFLGLRWFDMKRLAVDGRYNKTLTRTINGELHTLEPGSDKYVVNISPDIINQNPNL
jgi:hypothetical protein